MKVSFILVEPAVPGNIGASARAIKTMGYKDFRLVNPCDHLSTEARMMAHGSGDVLEKAGLFGGLDEALADLDLSVATSAKKRDARTRFHTAQSLPGIIRSKGRTVKNIGIVFGREESGLTNDEIRMCDLASGIPLKESFPSLNLAQSVMIYAYTLAEFSPAEQTPMQMEMQSTGKFDDPGPSGGSMDDSPHWETGFRDPEQKEFRIMMERSGDLLRKIGMDRNPALYNRIMERIALLGEDDIHLLLSVIGRLG